MFVINHVNTTNCFSAFEIPTIKSILDFYKTKIELENDINVKC